MRVPVYLVCAALAVAIKSEEIPSYYGRQLEPLDMSTEQDSLRYIFPQLSRFRYNNNWDDNRYTYDIPDFRQSNSVNEVISTW